MDTYRLFVYRDDDQLVGPATVIDAASRVRLHWCKIIRYADSVY
jgi:hypothetical protein